MRVGIAGVNEIRAIRIAARYFVNDIFSENFTLLVRLDLRPWMLVYDFTRRE